MLRRDALHVISGSEPSVGRCRCTKPERLPTLVGGYSSSATLLQLLPKNYREPKGKGTCPIGKQDDRDGMERLVW